MEIIVLLVGLFFILAFKVRARKAYEAALNILEEIRDSMLNLSDNDDLSLFERHAKRADIVSKIYSSFVWKIWLWPVEQKYREEIDKHLNKLEV